MKNLYEEACCDVTVFVRKYPKGDMYYKKGAPYSACSYSALLGYFETFMVAKQKAHTYLVERVTQIRLESVQRLLEAETFLLKAKR